MKRNVTFIVSIALLVNSLSLFAQTVTLRTPKQFTASFDAFILETMKQIPDIPGIAVVVIKDDKPIFVKAYGVADKEYAINADTETLYYIASSTKSFTALAASMLDKEGKIRFADPVTKYTQGIQFKSTIPDRITIRDLLTHTSGLRNDAIIHRTAYSGQVDRKEMAHVFANATTVVDKRVGNYNYTNLGYNIYGFLLENNLNKKWQDLLEERIFDPAGMRHTTARISKAKSKKWHVAAPYVFDPEVGKTVRSTLDKVDNNMQAAGGMFTSIEDIGRWLNLQMNKGRLNGKQVIPAELIRASQTGFTKVTRGQGPFTGEGEYGLGWQIGRYRSEKVIYHHGGYPGYSSHVSFLPEKKIAVAVMTNNAPVGQPVGDIVATYAIDWWLGAGNLEADYAKRLNDLVRLYTTRKQQSTAAAVERAKRSWQLSKPFADYAGKYTNDIFGTIEIIPMKNAFMVRNGNVNTIATPFTQKDAIRVVMQPGGNGEVITFNADAQGKFASLTYGGVTFTKVPS